MSDASASAAICGLRQTTLARLEQNEDFRALKGLERALADVTEIKLPPAQHQATLVPALVDREVPAMRPLTPAKQPNVRPAREAIANFRSITGLSEDSLHFG